MSEKSEALRLANFLEMHWCNVDMPEAKAAAELRRLHQFAEDQIGRATAAEAALQMTKATHALKIAAVEAQRDALRAELKEATEAINDPAVNNLRTLPESIRVLCAQRDALLEALRTLFSYANTLEMRLLDADGEHRAMRIARAAIKMVEEGK